MLYVKNLNMCIATTVKIKGTMIGAKIATERICIGLYHRKRLNA